MRRQIGKLAAVLAVVAAFGAITAGPAAASAGDKKVEVIKAAPVPKP